MKAAVSPHAGNKVTASSPVGPHAGLEYVHITHNLYTSRKIKPKYCSRFYYPNCDKVSKKQIEIGPLWPSPVMYLNFVIFVISNFMYLFLKGTKC